MTILFASPHQSYLNQLKRAYQIQVIATLNAIFRSNCEESTYLTYAEILLLIESLLQHQHLHHAKLDFKSYTLVNQLMFLAYLLIYQPSFLLLQTQNTTTPLQFPTYS